MKNILNYQFYIAYKSRFTKIILILLALFAITFYSLIYLHHSGIIKLVEIASTVDKFSTMSLLDIVLNFYYSDKIILFVGAFVALFSMIEYGSGFIKVVHNPFSPSIYTVISKLIVIKSFILLSFIMVLVITIVSGVVFLPHNGLGDVSKFIGLSIIQIVVEFSFSALIMLFCISIKNTLLGLLGTLFYIMFIPITGYNLIDFIFRKGFKISNFSIARFLPYGNTYQLSVNDSSQHFLIAVISAVIFLLIGIYLSVRTYECKDIL